MAGKGAGHDARPLFRASYRRGARETHPGGGSTGGIRRTHPFALWPMVAGIRHPGILALVLALSTVAEVSAQAPDVRSVTFEQFQDVLEERAGSTTIVNVWATWCPPCHAELPLFVRLGKDLAFEQLEIVFLSMDLEEAAPAVGATLAALGWDGPAFRLVGDGTAFVLGYHASWSGALPATFVIGPEGDVRAFWQGAVDDYDDLRTRVDTARQP